MKQPEQIIKKQGFDVKGDIEKYMPNMSKMIGLMKPAFGWGDITTNWNENFLQIHNERKKAEQEALIDNIILPPIKLKHTVLGLTHNVDKGNDQAIKFLEFLDGIFVNLMEFIDVKDCGLLRTNFKNFLLFHENFLNYAGEFLALNSMLITKQYGLLGANCRIVDYGPDIDFLLLHKESKRLIPVEVLNITLTDEHFVSNEYIERFLLGKYTDKRKIKNKSGINYVLSPVIWAIDSDKNHNLLRLIKFFKETKMEVPGVSVPYVVSAAIVQEQLKFTFCSIYECYNPSNYFKTP